MARTHQRLGGRHAKPIGFCMLVVLLCGSFAIFGEEPGPQRRPAGVNDAGPILTAGEQISKARGPLGSNASRSDVTPESAALGAVVCPEGALQEPEVCGRYDNNGCDLSIPRFTDVNCGTTICGTGWVASPAPDDHDSDWYRFTLSQRATVKFCAATEFPCELLLAGVDDGPFCSNNVDIYGSALGDGNTPVCTQADIGPGTYVAVIKARFSKPGSLLCLSDPRYVATLNCTCASAFTYQGQLKQDGQPFEGLITTDFTLFNAQGGGMQTGPTLRLIDVPVTNGLFTVSLDFGREVFDGNPRWLEIAIQDGARPVVLSPRQPLMSTPYATHSCTAQTAETSQAVDWSGIANIPADVTQPHSLDASDGTPVDAVFVDSDGKVGIGTTSPAYTLHVKSAGQLNAFMAETTTNDYARIAVKTRDNEFFLQAENAVGNWFGVFQNGGTSSGWKWMIEKNTGEVGIGTTAPAAKLDVRGDVRLGASGDLFAPGGSENLRVVRGRVAGTGATGGGAGFESYRLDIGKYQIRFNTPFAEIPTFTATAIDVSEPRIITILAESTTAMEIQVWQKDGSKNDSGFHFMAIGPR